MDAGTGLTILGSAVGGAKLVEKLLGPTTEYLGEGLKNWTARRMENVSRVFSNASRRLGSKIDEPGAIPPKVLKEVLDGASFCDDENAAEDFPRDERGSLAAEALCCLQWLEVRHYSADTIEGRRDALERVPIYTEVSIEQLKAVHARTLPAEAGWQSGSES